MKMSIWLIFPNIFIKKYSFQQFTIVLAAYQERYIIRWEKLLWITRWQFFSNGMLNWTLISTLHSMTASTFKGRFILFCLLVDGSFSCSPIHFSKTAFAARKGDIHLNYGSFEAEAGVSGLLEHRSSHTPENLPYFCIWISFCALFILKPKWAFCYVFLFLYRKTIEVLLVKPVDVYYLNWN